MAKWLLKSEPDVFGYDDLVRSKREGWDGVRNYQARNFMRQMKRGDRAIFYHSNAKPPGVAGIARVCAEAYPDHFAFDPSSRYYDPKSDREEPRWFMVDVEFLSKADDVLSLAHIKDEASLADMELVRYGRLSVQAVKPREFAKVKKMAGLP